MLPHLTKNRESDKFRGFSYRKKLVDRSHVYVIKPTGKSKIVKSKVIAWDVFYQDTYLAEFDTLKEVKYFIKEKANN